MQTKNPVLLNRQHNVDASHNTFGGTSTYSPPTQLSRPSSRFSLRERFHKLTADLAQQRMLFGTAKVKAHAVEDRLQQLEQHDEEPQVKVCTPQRATETNGDFLSPSEQAASLAALDQNNMGDDDQEWGWPGLGTWPGFSKGSKSNSANENRKTSENGEDGSFTRPDIGYWHYSKK